MDQARAMAAKDDLSHDVLGSFNRRVAPAGAGRAAENIAYGYDSFEKTLGQWIDSQRAPQEPAAARKRPASASPAPRMPAANAPTGPWSLPATTRRRAARRASGLSSLPEASGRGRQTQAEGMPHQNAWTLHLNVSSGRYAPRPQALTGGFCSSSGRAQAAAHRELSQIVPTVYNLALRRHATLSPARRCRI